MNYKVIYHCGDEISIKTKTKSGRLDLTDKLLTISGKETLSISTEQIKRVELFRLHGLGRMLKIIHNEGVLFVTVVRFFLFDYFAVTNFFKTGKLHQELTALIRK